MVLCVQKFQNDIFNKKFLIFTNCKDAPNVLTKDVQNLVSKFSLKTYFCQMASIIVLTYKRRKELSTRFPNQRIFTRYQNPYEDQYLEKDELLPVIVLEKDKAKPNPIQIARTLFPPDFHYLPIHSHKTRTFYEFILGNIQFSKIKILNILSHQDCNQPLFQQKSFSRSFLPQHYTYYDYVWYHTWNIVKVHKMYLQYFQKEINEAYNYFGEKSSFVSEYTTTQQYETIHIKILCRQTKVKWWKKFNNNLISKSKINEWVSNNSKSTSQQNTSPLKKQQEEKEASFLLEKQKVMAELASATTVEEFEATLLKARSILDSDNADHSDTESSESNSYLRNGDMFD
ncbi:hypothetical protein CR513_30243, partial [Mucuna pruriens]